MRGKGTWLAGAVMFALIVAGLGAARRQEAAPPAALPVSTTLASQRTAPPAGRTPSSPGAVAVTSVAAAGDCGPALQSGAPPVAGDAVDPRSAQFDAAVDDVRRETLAHLVQSTDPRRQAAGLLLESRQELATQAACDGASGCVDDTAPPRPAVDRLAALARGSDSAWVYGLALEACASPATRPAASDFCASLSTERWAQLAPQNAWPWIRLASEARARSDVSGVENAMNHAAQATDWRPAGAGVAALVAEEWPADLQPVPRFTMTAEALGIEYSLLGAIGGLTAYCPADPDPGRRQTCLRLAEHMLDRTDNLLGLKIAIHLGERSGVPEARLAGLRHEAEVLMNAGPMAQLIADSASGAAFDCARVTRATVDLERQSRMGELAALRARQAERASPGGPR